MNKPLGKRISSVHPLEGALSFLGTLEDAFSGKDTSGRDTAMTDKVEDITIDTCIPKDTGIWETGILRESIEGKWIIVGQYKSDKEAKKGHKQWVEYMKEEPACELEDINLWNIPREGE